MNVEFNVPNWWFENQWKILNIFQNCKIDKHLHLRSTFFFTWPPKVQVKRILVAWQYASKLQNITITLDIPISHSKDHPKVKVKRICRAQNSAKNNTRLLHLRSLFLFHKITRRCGQRGYIGMKSKFCLWILCVLTIDHSIYDCCGSSLYFVLTLIHFLISTCKSTLFLAIGKLTICMCEIQVRI